MAKLIICRGNIASGKTTWAKEQVEKHGYVRVNRDELRKMMIIGKWNHKKEKKVVAMRDSMIEEAFRNDMSVICDDCNLSDRVVQHLTDIAMKYFDAEVEINDSFLQVPLEECIKRDSEREYPVGASVAIKMWEDYFDLFRLAQEIAVPEYDPKKRNCIICDLDGTLFLDPTGKHWYERDFENDIVVEHVSDMISMFATKYHIVFLSGRQAKYMDGTLEALDKIGWHPPMNCTLQMRNTGDQRNDAIVKEELYWEYVHPFYNVKFVIDDRPKVIRMWKHKLRFFVFDVNQRGDEF